MIDSRIILNRKIRPLVYIYIMILSRGNKYMKNLMCTFLNYSMYVISL